MLVLVLCALISAAFAADSRCTGQGGHCQVDSTSCSGHYASGLCDGAANRRCCIGADHLCTAQSGHCQADSGSCAGSYMSGLCSGASNRRCCVPHSAGGCTAEQKRLACILWAEAQKSSSSVYAFQVHVSGVHDNAFPYNNLRDMCNGHKASRSSYACNGCHAPGGTVCLSTDLLNYLVDLHSHGHITINELAGACHTCKSRHYSGLAVDLNIKDNRNSEYLQKCTAMGGWGQDEGNHIHCQFYDAPHPNGF